MIPNVFSGCGATSGYAHTKHADRMPTDAISGGKTKIEFWLLPSECLDHLAQCSEKEIAAKGERSSVGRLGLHFRAKNVHFVLWTKIRKKNLVR